MKIKNNIDRLEGGDVYKRQAQSSSPFVQIFSLQAALVSSLGALGADELQVCQNSGLETLDLGQVLIPHLGVGQHGVHQLSSGVVLVCIVEVQSPCVILELVRCV